MKTFITGLLRGRLTRRNMLAAVLPATGISLAWTQQAMAGQKVNRLGGAWIGADGAGLLLNHIQIPLDPEGKTAALHVHSMTYSQANAGLFTALGADTLTDFAGPAVMISKDTAQATLLGYVQASGNPPAVTAIVVLPSIFRFADSDTIVGDYSISAFPPSADGMPHGDPLPPGPVPAPPITLRRVLQA